jgi:hypothetical protein
MRSGEQHTSSRKRWVHKSGCATGERILAGIVTLLFLMAPCLVGTAHGIENTASGTVNASPLDTTNATVILNLVTGVPPTESR